MSPMHKKVSLFWMQWGRVNSRHRVKKETRSMWVKHSHWERTNRFGGIWTRIPAMLATDPRKTANPQKARYTNDGRAQQWTEVIPHSTVDRMGDYFFLFYFLRHFKIRSIVQSVCYIQYKPDIWVSAGRRPMSAFTGQAVLHYGREEGQPALLLPRWPLSDKNRTLWSGFLLSARGRFDDLNLHLLGRAKGKRAELFCPLRTVKRAKTATEKAALYAFLLLFYADML